MEKQYIKAQISKDADGDIEFIASDETKDRHGDVIPLDSWDLKNFLKAPRMLIDHYHSVEKIVGRWDDVRVERSGDKKGLKMKAVFHKITELARETKEMVVQGFLDTVSVGFIPNFEKGINDDGDEVEIQRNELVEVSFVTVPANPNASQIKSLLEKEDEKVDLQLIEEFIEVPVDKSEIMIDVKSVTHASNSGGLSVELKVNDEIQYINIDHDLLPDYMKRAINGTGGAPALNDTSKPNEKRSDTHKVKEKARKSRSLSIRRQAVAKRAMKEAVKHLSFALNQVNKKDN